MKHQKIEFYRHPAGGWGALKSVAHQLLSQGIAAKGAKTMLSANQPDGFDCPGCAWPDRDHASTFEFCENGVKAVAAEATSRRTTPEFFAQHTVRELAEWSDYALEDQGRLTHPMVYDAGSDKYVPIDWDAAFALIAQHLRALPDPNQAIFYTSGRTSNEAAFLYQLFVRAYGTNNFPDCSNMCHEPSGTGMRASIGVGKGTVTLDDFTKTDAIFIFGQNPGTNHPRMLGELREASKRGASIVSFNPLRERGLERFADPQSKIEMLTLGSTRISTEYHQVRIGGDLATVKGIIKHVIERDDAARSRGEPAIIDHAFIAQHTGGYDAFAADVRAESWATIEAESGLPEHEIRQAGDTYIKAGSVIACWGMGITQHKHSVATIQMIVNLLLLRGNIGRPGAGACPVRGHSNVQGDRTMGIYEKPAPAFLDRLEKVFSIQVPREHGYDTVGAIEAMQQGAARVFFAMGGNFAAATPDTAATWAGLRQCDLTVHVTTKLNRSHIVHGKAALILPCLGRTEVDQQAGGAQGVTVEDSMSMVHMSAGINPPASPHLLSEPAIVARLAEATLPESTIPWRWLVEDYDRIRERIEAVFDDFAGFNEKIRVPGGFRLRNTASERVWNTPSGKAEFHAHAVPTDTPVHRARERHADATVFTLATVRSHDQYNTTIYGMDDRYRGVFGQRRVVFINKEDLHTVRMKDGEWVDMVTLSEDGTTRRADGFRLVAYDIPRGCLAAYYPETNPLVPLSSVADQARTPTSKSIPVMLVPSQVARTADTQAATTAEA
ncbi:MAG: FdhF/YdeP family oxidoreductase [Ralstonia sp.]|jgi:molybdopterin-dependent oxidoreductase alpha subunit|uniref:FdhF/YdeP family oxidoreductase n=1 Tax=Ralstonia pickettii TaxID=329 RepID=A0A9Q2GYW4_RALPI|nr:MULTISPECIES: FdhF/YdeP family oxidoreductase [Ralstonia]EFP68069.1 oxidoreductase alpha (molybdopterin) subunit [Ralstonia pickettii]EGY61529.1 oxidoreductase alpha (molybdopterin) subunit [Ralstonia sp. 5_2_56FAA]KFL22559.1 molybdopterin oxidoreductase family protein [Ralstonia pickettii]MBA9848066.1 CbbBc protein [Ralstonia pickettii]MBA9853577.1 CbbBc protein [Ralstonia pickettii]